MSIFSSEPSNFFCAVSISGKPADLGRECPTCHSTIRYGIVPGQKITCCRITETAPDTSAWSDLPSRSLRPGMPELNQGGYILLDTEASNYGESDWDRDSAAHSEVPWT